MPGRKRPRSASEAGEGAGAGSPHVHARNPHVAVHLQVVNRRVSRSTTQLSLRARAAQHVAARSCPVHGSDASESYATCTCRSPQSPAAGRGGLAALADAAAATPNPTTNDAPVTPTIRRLRSEANLTHFEEEGGETFEFFSPMPRKNRRQGPKPAPKTPVERKKQMSLSEKAKIACQYRMLVECKHLPTELKGVLYKGRPIETGQQLAKHYDVAWTQVRAWAGVLKGNGKSLERKAGSGRPTIMTPSKVAVYEQHLDDHADDATYEELQEALMDAGKGRIGVATLKRYHDAMGYKDVPRGFRPKLTPRHRRLRRGWSASIRGKCLHRYVELDEKWFYLLTKRRKLKVRKGKKPKKTAVTSKRYIPKAMVVCVIGRPCKCCGFDGKPGVWRCATEEKAKRPSKYRPAGATVWKPFTINKQTFTDLLINTIFPAIRSSFEGSEDIHLQFDGASPHTAKYTQEAIDKENDRAFLAGEAVIIPHVQSPQSPDTNLNDLSFFSSLDSRVSRKRKRTTEQIFDRVEEEYNKITPQELEKHHQLKMVVNELIYENNGDNTYALPHGVRERYAGFAQLDLDTNGRSLWYGSAKCYTSQVEHDSDEESADEADLESSDDEEDSQDLDNAAEEAAHVAAQIQGGDFFSP